jgi:hypothetical protein
MKVSNLFHIIKQLSFYGCTIVSVGFALPALAKDSQIHENFFGLGMCRRNCRLSINIASDVQTVRLPTGQKARMASFIRHARKGPGASEYWHDKKRANVYAICETGKIGVAEPGKLPAVWESYQSTQAPDSKEYVDQLCQEHLKDADVLAVEPSQRNSNSVLEKNKKNLTYLDSFIERYGTIEKGRITKLEYSSKPNPQLTGELRAKMYPDIDRMNQDFTYSYAEVDLNNDGKQDAFVKINSSVSSGTGGAHTRVFLRTNDGYKLIHIFYHQVSLTVLDRRGSQWKEILVVPGKINRSENRSQTTYDWFHKCSYVPDVKFSGESTSWRSPNHYRDCQTITKNFVANGMTLDTDIIRHSLPSFSIGNITSTKNFLEFRPNDFEHGCGTGCAVHISFLSNVKQIEAQDGRTLRYARINTRVSGAGRDGTESGTSDSYIFAHCSTNSLGYSTSTNLPVEPEDWQKLNDPSKYYTTTGGFFEGYLDSLCIGGLRP